MDIKRFEDRSEGKHDPFRTRLLKYFRIWLNETLYIDCIDSSFHASLLSLLALITRFKQEECYRTEQGHYF